ncbi:MAG: hypothetical protein J0M04_21415 [Verrucomicrobia bacterium]|nr:hypothetical protein [Verrucomicrobiota bacterium]
MLASDIVSLKGDYPQVSQRVSEALAKLESDEQRTLFMEGLIRTLPPDLFEIQWNLAGEFVESITARTNLLAEAIRDAAKVDRSWAFEKLRSHEDPVVCEAALQGVVKSIKSDDGLLETVEIIRKELGDSDVYSQALYHWLSELHDQPEVSIPLEMAKELLFDPRVNAKMKEQFADIYISSADAIPPLEAARLLDQEKVLDGGWKQIVAAGAKLTGAEADEFIGLVFNASKYRIIDFMGEYMKSNQPEHVFDRIEAYPENARVSMLCATSLYAIENNRISELLSKVDQFPESVRGGIIESVMNDCGRNHIPRERIEAIFQYGGGNPKLEKIYNHYLPK